MNMQNSKSKQLLDKVYNRLDSIDIGKLSLRELEDFLGVVQKGQFLEATGQIPPYGFTGVCATPFGGPGKPEEADSAAE